MKIFLSLAVLVAVANANLLQRNIEDYKFEAFKKMHGKTYGSYLEEDLRRNIFIDRLRRVDAHNADPTQTYKQTAFHKYGDLTLSEFSRTMNGYRSDLRSLVSEDLQAKQDLDDPRLSLLGRFRLPEHVDWRAKGAVTPVKDQGQCGSCWAFSATGVLESQNFLKHGKLVELSEQQLVDCAGGKYENEGCNGGLPENALQYIHDNGGIDGEKDYPYKEHNGDVTEECQFKADNVKATDNGVKEIPSGNEQALQQAVAIIGPVSIAIDAGHESFMNYHSGVFVEDACMSGPYDLDHAVLAVGYGHDQKSGMDYWLVKNSWTTQWGNQGYIKMARNKNNMCGVATMAVYPLE